MLIRDCMAPDPASDDIEPWSISGIGLLEVLFPCVSTMDSASIHVKIHGSILGLQS